ncbi:MAG TPA: hypothetical protein VGH74_00290, partial [Planctomycetaceae bacterium]
MKTFRISFVVALAVSVAAVMRLMANPSANSDAANVAGRMTMKTEAFDRDPGWLGVNNRSARMHEPVAVRQ